MTGNKLPRMSPCPAAYRAPFTLLGTPVALSPAPLGPPLVTGEQVRQQVTEAPCWSLVED